LLIPKLGEQANVAVKNVVTQWLLTWGVLGLLTGIGLSFGDTGHLPVSWLIIIVLVGAVVAGMIAGLTFSWVTLTLLTSEAHNPISRAVTGAIAGAVSALLLGWFVLGVQWSYALIWGALAGVISVVVGLHFESRA
jgi:hypothetical protein